VSKTKFRPLSKGIGEAVAARTILRKTSNKLDKDEDWGDVAKRVALGNTMLVPGAEKDREALEKHIANGSLLMSGRHLQHGDETQPERNMEVFTNCSTASSSFILFYLLMNGSGVGRAYDDDMCMIDWDYMPNLKLVLDGRHPDYNQEQYLPKSAIDTTDIVFDVPDTREGWAQAVEKIEVMAFEKSHRDEVLVIDFSKVRERGRPIRGMQNRPASGPGPLADALRHVTTVKGMHYEPWKQAMIVDHYLAECVLVGGARRSARIATKVWTDDNIIDFINIKRGGKFWSANNSVCVDKEFWLQNTRRAKRVLNSIVDASYYDNTGEPGIINQHKLVQNDKGYKGYTDGSYVLNGKYGMLEGTKEMLAATATSANTKKYTQIVNPCGEISLNMLGGYCVIADVVPYHSDSDEDAEEAFRLATRALIRVNTMNCLYSQETKRTNRIGVSMTGIHEYAWKRFNLTFNDLIDEKKSKPFWDTLNRFKAVVVQEAEKYSKELGVHKPHTNTTIKPAGTTSKLFSLTEGAHLPSMREYIRWVQFRYDDPLVKKYEKLGYPTKRLETYNEATIVGFPTQTEICRIMPPEKLVTATEATPEQQYKWLQLLEKYWIVGTDENGHKQPDTGNQISYTLKWLPDQTTIRRYKTLLIDGQSKIKACSIMPQTEDTAYEYQPEEPVTAGRFIDVVNNIQDSDIKEDIDLEHLKCQSGVCPI
jgi:adenosylcobalamin-dependent ribonucleoside-triphosphate reductase